MGTKKKTTKSRSKGAVKVRDLEAKKGPSGGGWAGIGAEAILRKKPATGFMDYTDDS